MSPATTAQAFALREACERAVERASDVLINDTALLRLAAEFIPHADQLASTPEPFAGDSHLFESDDQYAQWLFTLDALNFSFWPDDALGRWYWPHDLSTSHSAACAADCMPSTGAIALGNALRHAMKLDTRLADASFLALVTTDELLSMTGGAGELPMLDLRRQVLNDVGRTLTSKYSGQVANLIRSAEGSVATLLAAVAHDFISLRDVVTLDGAEIPFLKRAQIFVSDLFQLFGGRGLGRFDDINILTAFADYKLPQVLRSTGVVEYSPELADLIERRRPLEYGSRMEVEIRAATVVAVRRLRDELSTATGLDVLTCRLDNELWWLSQQPEFKDAAPHHRTRTIHY